MRLFYVWHESQMGPPRIEMMVVRAKSVMEALQKFDMRMGDKYCEYLITLQVKACDNIYLD